MEMPSSPMDLETLDKDAVINREGQRYAEFRKTLAPRYARVWGGILVGLGLTLGLWGLTFFMQLRFPALWFLTVPFGAVLIGYGMAFVQLFFHEGTHYNLAADRRRNDRLADTFIGLWVGQCVADYRAVHWEHHRRLGETDDSEFSYFYAPGLRFLLKTLFGVHALRIARARRRRANSSEDSCPGRTRGRWMLAAGLLVNGSMVAGAALAGFWQPAASWAAGMLMFFPFFASVRQLLEHRDDHASPRTDYRKVAHGRVSRIFKDGPIGSILGGAGFNRHLLHHWDPQIPCTRLREVEAFLLDSDLAESVRAASTNYFSTWIRLVRGRVRTRPGEDHEPGNP